MHPAIAIHYEFAALVVEVRETQTLVYFIHCAKGNVIFEGFIKSDVKLSSLWCGNVCKRRVKPNERWLKFSTYFIRTAITRLFSK